MKARRIAAGILSLVMLAGLFPASAMAARFRLSSNMRHPLEPLAWACCTMEAMRSTYGWPPRGENESKSRASMR